MKTAFSIILFVLYLNGNSQDITDSLPVNSETGLIEFSFIDSVKENQSVLYDRATLFFNRLFNNSKNAIHSASRESGNIITKGSIPFIYYELQNKRGKVDTAFKRGEAGLTIKLFCKDGKYKAIVTDIALNGSYMWDGDKLTRQSVETLKEAKTSNKIDLNTYYSTLSKYRGFVDQINGLFNATKKAMGNKGDSEF